MQNYEDTNFQSLIVEDAVERTEEFGFEDTHVNVMFYYASQNGGLSLSEEELEGFIYHDAIDIELDFNNINELTKTPRGIHRCTRTEIDANFYKS